MEEVIGKMQTGHKAMVQNMIDDFKQCSPPPKVLEPLQAVLDDSAMRGHEFFNVRSAHRFLHAPTYTNAGSVCGRCPSSSAKRRMKSWQRRRQPS